MATEQTFVDYVLEQAALGDRLTSKKMFGEFAFYVDGRVVALACDNHFFLKPSAAVGELAPNLPERPPYPGARPCRVADELLDEPELLSRLILRTAELLPLPKAKKISAESR